ncbi:hypothetical protein [Algoriphagus chordae]|nr:hypothetical protein [Algoriphagus chordae]
MKINTNRQAGIFEGGKESWEKTAEFRKKVAQMKKQLQDKYEPDFSSQKNWVKRLILKTRVWLLIRKKISELKSGENLHFSS